jgi:hypothetical protein
MSGELKRTGAEAFRVEPAAINTAIGLVAMSVPWRDEAAGG